jgi:hypothetical protein
MQPANKIFVTAYLFVGHGFSRAVKTDQTHAALAADLFHIDGVSG